MHTARHTATITPRQSHTTHAFADYIAPRPAFVPHLNPAATTTERAPLPDRMAGSACRSTLPKCTNPPTVPRRATAPSVPLCAANATAPYAASFAAPSPAATTVYTICATITLVLLPFPLPT
jgi:hypothetical protein